MLRLWYAHIVSAMSSRGVLNSERSVASLSAARAAVDFAHRLAAVRKDKGLTQQAVADRGGVHVSQIRRYEAGTPQPLGGWSRPSRSTTRPPSSRPTTRRTAPFGWRPPSTTPVTLRSGAWSKRRTSGPCGRWGSRPTAASWSSRPLRGGLCPRRGHPRPGGPAVHG